jgi:hypothetical protein
MNRLQNQTLTVFEQFEPMYCDKLTVDSHFEKKINYLFLNFVLGARQLLFFWLSSINMFTLVKLIICVLCCLSTAFATPSDRIESLPGIGRLAQKTYAGFINVNRKYGAYLYYYFVESQNKPTDPVVLWLQGGPGCSVS